ncbi:MAG TPA: DUF2283 domain-containing protein [Methylomirabilota bacterium]|nr:DUF2283 domain-containing protein [Methylomirabilota bacterium]
MEQRGITEIELRSMLQRARGYSPSVAAGRFMIATTHRDRPWIIIVEPARSGDRHGLRAYPMTERSLQVTYRRGRPFAAYLYLSRTTGERSSRSEASPDGLLVVDYAADGRPIGLEITAPEAVTLDRVNVMLRQLGQPPLPEQDFRPLTAA